MSYLGIAENWNAGQNNINFAAWKKNLVTPISRPVSGKLLSYVVVTRAASVGESMPAWYPKVHGVEW